MHAMVISFVAMNAPHEVKHFGHWTRQLKPLQHAHDHCKWYQTFRLASGYSVSSGPLTQHITSQTLAVLGARIEAISYSI